MKTSFWLLKTEPSTYSFAQLLEDGKTNWSGVRNFQARNNLRELRKGDVALIYHSGDDKAVVGVARCVREAYPDPDPKKKGDWVQVDLVPVEELGRPVTLSEIRQTRELKDLPLIRHTRLSVMPISSDHYKRILKLGGAKKA
jgi:predicted RNA-binding protein with PUA-like domain